MSPLPESVRDAVLAPQRWAGPLGGPERCVVDSPTSGPLALWDAGSTDELPAALDALDARAVAALLRAWLRGAGVSAVPRGSLPATRANPAGLTARQLDALSLLADGLSNADIATRLVISRKTADHHVSAILAKMDVCTRGEAAVIGRRRGVWSW